MCVYETMCARERQCVCVCVCGDKDMLRGRRGIGHQKTLESERTKAGAPRGMSLGHPGHHLMVGQGRGGDDRKRMGHTQSRAQVTLGGQEIPQTGS